MGESPLDYARRLLPMKFAGEICQYFAAILPNFPATIDFVWFFSVSFAL